ncbi:conjugal transfer protein TraG [Faecalibacterium sp. An58]|uniref:VirD4-like conjugal transfer protein, CD1115 family n=1 Tax=Faecalibacterium sp. An58 TaxID=1965648 RepID=UPI000B37CA84|nr:type IV secretory system conjugative DNA transfer family protein [Faecalibacterium sp. An58]OUN71594.1 conjugal transfer protein TraG [Faecalibacterium sp. An58]
MNQNTKRLVLLNLPYVLMGLYATNLGYAWRLAVGADFSEKMMSLMSVLPGALGRIVPSFHPLDLAVGLCCGVGLRLAVYLKSKNAKKYRHGSEYGSARWGNAKDIEPYVAPKFEDNIILTQTERLTMSSHSKDPKTARNKNVLIVGGSGSGKTRFWIKPNLLQMHSSYVLTDPKGTTVLEVGNAFLKKGYCIKIFNTINFKKSMHYNPFVYIHSEKDILKLVTTLMTNTRGEGKGGDPFWDKAEKLLLTSLIAYIHYEAPAEEQNFATLLEFLNIMEVREDDEEFQNPVDLMFEDLAKQKPDHFAVRQYRLYKLAAGKTAKSILISCGARLAPFDIAELREITAYDELELDTLGDRKTALFLIMSDTDSTFTDSTFNFLISMVYTQLFNLLCEKADDVYGGRLPVHVRCLIDECANIGQIPNLEKLVATIRSREISACLVLQAQSQLKALYKDNADTIIGNMDSQIFLGGSENTTLKELAATLGKETIDLYNTSDTRGNSPSYGTSYQKTGHELMSRDELAVMDGGKCILQLRGVRPFLSDKYDLTQHPNYKLTGDYDKKNMFDIEKFLNRRLKLKPSDVYDVVDADLP